MKHEKMKLTPFEDIVDDIMGPKGTPERDAMEEQCRDDLQAFRVGEAIKKARLKQNLTQEELGRRVGVKRSQICNLERGRCSITLPTMARIFSALGFKSATLDLGDDLKVTLW